VTGLDSGPELAERHELSLKRLGRLVRRLDRLVWMAGLNLALTILVVAKLLLWP
jgi:hypothetical protein